MILLRLNHGWMESGAESYSYTYGSTFCQRVLYLAVRFLKDQTSSNSGDGFKGSPCPELA